MKTNLNSQGPMSTMWKVGATTTSTMSSTEIRKPTGTSIKLDGHAEKKY